ncbi:hypothetical protein SDC9_114375 [bioreactor metagenome]|uniref:Uncharacterized protein n=1 Tax=bioreactor metagenome TaxID=1076179 RepID=A0A645BWE4_9ZZZZ
MPVKREGGRRLAGAVEAHERRKVQVAHGVSAEHQKILPTQVRHAGLHAARRAERLLLHKIGQADAPPASVPKVIHHQLRHVLQGNADIGYAVVFQQAEDVLHHRPIKQGGHGLGAAQRQGPQAGALSAGHNYSFHEDTSFPFGNSGQSRIIRSALARSQIFCQMNKSAGNACCICEHLYKMRQKDARVGAL